MKKIQYIEISLAIEQDKVYYFKCKHLFGFLGGRIMTDREKLLIEMIRKSDDPSAAMDKVRKILSSGRPPAREGLHPAKREKRS